MPAVPRLIISAIRGGLGKTTLALGITSAWRKQGKRTAVFKKGPDFIDAGWLGAAAGRACYNLDPFIMAPNSIVRSFTRHSENADVAIIEGNRGLYDGVDEAGTYSTARLAKLLTTPVVLIVDCTKSSSTVAAVVLGCSNFDPETPISGVILNNVSAGRHETVVRRAIEQSSGIPVVGAVPRQRKGEFPERHMGLTPFHEHPQVEQAISAAASVATSCLDLNALWAIAASAQETALDQEPESGDEQRDNTGSPVIGVIRDTAFQFYYPDNLEDLERHGARLVQINALEDASLPEIDALYIGGGFPETQAAELAANERFCRSVRDAAEQGMPIYAECGGLIYLGRTLQVPGRVFPMTGVLPLDFVLEQRPQAHGYTVLTAADNTFFETGVTVRGHEFHYSRVINPDNLSPFAYVVSRGAGINGKGDGLVYKNVVAAYTHIHALGTPEWAPALIKKACDFRKHHETTSRKQVLN